MTRTVLMLVAWMIVAFQAFVLDQQNKVLRQQTEVINQQDRTMRDSDVVLKNCGNTLELLRDRFLSEVASPARQAAPAVIGP